MSKFTIALIGNPNAGKSTLFNALTGMHQTIGNWSGVTVERKSGTFYDRDDEVHIVDLPGIYHLASPHACALDEKVTLDYFLSGEAQLIVNVIDVTHLSHGLYLTSQLLELNIPVVLAVTMMDVAKKHGISVDLEQLSACLGCPVVSLVGHKKRGIPDLKKTIVQSLRHPSAQTPMTSIAYSPSCEDFIRKLETLLTREVPKAKARFFALRLLEGTSCMPFQLSPSLIQEVQSLIHSWSNEESIDLLIADARYSWIRNSGKKVLKNLVHAQAFSELSQKIDRWVLNRFLGLPIFLGIIYAVFFFSIRVGGFLQNFFALGSRSVLVDGWLRLLAHFSISNPLLQWVGVGVGEGLSTVLTFIPVLGCLFFALSVLELSGYMVRGAFVMDRLMSWLGLPGKAFLPMVLGFGCNVPGILACRTLEQPRDRILAVLMNPFMSCGARLAVYSVFVAAFFPRYGENVIFGLYWLGIVIAIVTGWLLQKTFLRGPKSFLVMDLPSYQRPSWRQLINTTWGRLKNFLVKAGIIILPACFVLSLLSHVTLEGKFQNNSSQSVVADVGKMLTPVFHPMGIDQSNWPATVGLMTGVLAKETVIGSLNTLYAQEEICRGTACHAHGRLYHQLIRHFHGSASAIAYLIFILLYMPCVAAIAAIARELNKKWAIFSLIWSTVLAYGLAVLFYQVATLIQRIR